MNNLPDIGQSPISSNPNIPSAETPLDFIRKNLKQPEAINGGIVENILAKTSASFTGQASIIESLPEKPKEEIVAAEGEEKKPVPTLDSLTDLLLGDKKEQSSEQLEDPEDVAQDIKTGPKESLKILRKKSKELERLSSEQQVKLTDLESQVARFRSGEDIPQELKDGYENRISELEKYEKLHALKLSKEYQKKFIEPASKLKEEVDTLAEDYQVDVSVFEKAAKIDNKRELHAFLRNHFDDVGVIEARDLVQKIKDIRTEARQAEHEPAEALKRIRTEYAQREAQEAEARINSIINNSKDGWQQSLTELSQNGEFPELTLKANNEEHNKVVRPIIESAAQEYGKFIKLLGQAGIKDLPPEATKILAKRFQLSQAAAIMAASRAEHYNRAQDAISDSKKYANMIRPPIGAVSDGGRENEPKLPSSPTEAADFLLGKVMSRR